MPVIMISAYWTPRECGTHFGAERSYVFNGRVATGLILAMKAVLSGAPYEPRQCCGAAGSSQT